MKSKIPKEIIEVAEKLISAKFEAYLVGGCVRDILRDKKPTDFDIATNARPEEVLKIFPDGKYENEFGTVLVKTDSKEETLKMIEITTYRIEGRYSDYRRPDEVKFAKTINEDLSRRDFTVNAIALNLDEVEKNDFIDPHGGRDDLGKKIIQTVGNPEERFREDALRLLRAVRLSVQLGFEIEDGTLSAIRKNAHLLGKIAIERIRDEFRKTIITENAAEGIYLMEKTDLLEYIIPELKEGVGSTQNKHHIYTTFEHNVRALRYTAEKDYSFEIRLASLLHDVGKPRTKRGEGENSTFYGHEVVGSRMTRKILERLKFSKHTIDHVVHLVRFHLFYYNVGEVTEAGVRRFLARVGPENVDDLIKVREADRIGSGVPKAVPYKLRHLLFMIEKVKHDPIHPKMLALKGDELMKLLSIPPSPKVGQILSILLEEVLDNPKLNTKKHLEKRAKELSKSDGSELKEMMARAMEKKQEMEKGIEDEMKKKYAVK